MSFNFLNSLMENASSLKVDAGRAKRLGFQGKLCIHPNQIEPLHAIFSPTKEEILYAERVVQVFEEAEREGSAAITLDGKFIDYAVVERARRIRKVVSNE